jgi:4-carboxymuconolactone decarboxylase
MPDTPTFGRYAEIPYEQMTPEQQEGYRSMMESRGGLPGPSKIWIHNRSWPRSPDRSAAISMPAITPLSEREREIAVCVITSRFHSAYPTNAHERRGKEVGLPADKVEAIVAGCDVIHGRTRAGRLRDGDGVGQCALGAAWPL